ncbi:hypothetical protein [Streptomyces amakusaensis]|uniref:Uncharacterized protein n=1 Tax=Streptomyces amakusaensis TaxID=67271 RepID=A0ABW0AQ10_9ACTN
MIVDLRSARGPAAGSHAVEPYAAEPPFTGMPSARPRTATATATAPVPDPVPVSLSVTRPSPAEEARPRAAW